MSNGMKNAETFLLVAEEQRELLGQHTSRQVHYSETWQETKLLCFNGHAYQDPHPKKLEIRDNHRDADATVTSPMLLGICDGVSQLEDFGLDASALPRELLQRCEELASNQLIPDEHNHWLKPGPDPYGGPIELLKEAFSETVCNGSTSVLLAVLDNSTSINGRIHPMIGMVSLGDCESVLLRRKGGPTSQLEVVLRTEMQRIGGHGQIPFQLARMDRTFGPGMNDDDGLKTIEKGSNMQCTSALEGDVVVIGSDGLFDNLFLEEVVEIVNECLPPRAVGGKFKAARSEDIATLSHVLVAEAHLKANKQASTPVGPGGKFDDTSAIVGELVEWTPAVKQKWSQGRRRKKMNSLLKCGVPECAPCGYDSEDSTEDDVGGNECCTM